MSYPRDETLPIQSYKSLAAPTRSMETLGSLPTVKKEDLYHSDSDIEPPLSSREEGRAMYLTIWKYNVKPGLTNLIAQNGAEVLDVQVQHGQPVLWALVNPAQSTTRYRVWAIGTGHEFPEDAISSNYIGTFQLEGQVWHVFTDLDLYKPGGVW
jgi:hypothetical protein